MFASSKGVILRSEATKNLVFGKQVTRDAKNETLRLRLRVTIAGRQSINTKQGDHRIWQLGKRKMLATSSQHYSKMPSSQRLRGVL
jgi:hypothetical protein